jgi:hypothetical protein
VPARYELSGLSITGRSPGNAGAQWLRSRTTGQHVAVYLQAAGSDADGAALYRVDFNCLT